MNGLGPGYEPDVLEPPVPPAPLPRQGEAGQVDSRAYRGGRYAQPTVYPPSAQPPPVYQDPSAMARRDFPPRDAGRSAGAAQPVRPSTASLAVTYSIRTILYILGVIEVLLAIRFVFILFAANSSADFSGLIYGVTGPLVTPFEGVFGNPGADAHAFDSASVLAGIVYALAAWGIVSLLTLYRRRRTEIVTPEGLPPLRPVEERDGVHP